MSDQFSAKMEEERATLKNLGKKGRSVTQEDRLLFLRTEKRRIQQMMRSRRHYKNLTEDQRENRNSAQRNWKRNLDDDRYMELVFKNTENRRRNKARQVTPPHLQPA